MMLIKRYYDHDDYDYDYDIYDNDDVESYIEQNN